MYYNSNQTVARLKHFWIFSYFHQQLSQSDSHYCSNEGLAPQKSTFINSLWWLINNYLPKLRWRGFVKRRGEDPPQATDT